GEQAGGEADTLQGREARRRQNRQFEIGPQPGEEHADAVAGGEGAAAQDALEREAARQEAGRQRGREEQRAEDESGQAEASQQAGGAADTRQGREARRRQNRQFEIGPQPGEEHAAAVAGGEGAAAQDALEREAARQEAGRQRGREEQRAEDESGQAEASQQ